LKVIGFNLLSATVLAAAACSQGGSSATQPEKQETMANTAPVPEVALTEPASKAPVAGAPAAGPEQGERRCGWLSNPTPGNWWLTDRDGQWDLAAQGGEQAPGMDEIPDMSTAGWVETNGHYGYGCACIKVAHDPATRRVTRIADAEPKPISQCQADKGLPRPQ
jgi:hypothetical protein